jgi:(heptosyl)LPS beta-1,4-glucosyltransferase
VTPSIAACIVCCNEADRLVDCLASVDWVDEILVIDLESDDDSAAVAERLGARVLTRPRLPIVEPFRNVAADAVTADWILAVDPDERVEPGLARALREASVREDIDVVEIPFMNEDLGFPASHPTLRYDPKPRMYRRDRIRWPEAPHALPTYDAARAVGRPARDELVMRHVRSRNLAEILDRAVRYAPAQAQEMLDRGEVFSARRMITDLSDRAYRQFVVARAYRDGVPGILRAVSLVHYHFCVWLELWQRSGTGRTPEDDAYLARAGGRTSTVWRAARLPRRAWAKLRRSANRPDVR